MPFRRETQVDANPLTTYEAVRTVLSPHVEGGSFLVWEDEPGAFYGIASRTTTGSARYRFALEPHDAGTRIEGTLWLGGIVGPLHSLLRRGGNRRHVDDLLNRMKRLAEGELPEEDDAFDDEDNDAFDDEDDDDYDDDDGDDDEEGNVVSRDA